MEPIQRSRIQSFKEFYSYYLSEHSKKGTRIWHYIGTTAFFALLIGGFILGQYKLFVGLPLAGYGCAWIGHFFVEKNKPATFQYPLWSLASDFVMYFQWLSGRLKRGGYSR
ncbi:MAG: Mpo1-like protein [Bacteroidota bacterium]